jgi:O-antigen/teichoic acid export membrane protein
MNHQFISRFIKGIASRSIGTFFQVFMGILSLSIAARFVSKDDFGIYVLILIITSFFSILNSLILQNISITKFIAGSEEDRQTEVVNTAIFVNIITSLAITMLVFLCKPLISYIFRSEQISRYLIYIPLIYIMGAFDSLFQKILQGFHQFMKMAISQIINTLIRVVLIILFLIFLKMGMIGLIYAMVLSYICSLVFQYSAIRVKKQLHFSPSLYIQMVKFGFPLGLNDVLSFIFLKTDRLMIGAMLNSTGVAYYEIASKIPDGSRNMFTSFIEVYFPSMVELFSNKKKVEAQKVLNNSLRVFSFFSIFFTLLLALFQKEIVAFLFSKEYIGIAPALPILMFALTIGLFGNIMGTTLVALGQSDKPVKVNIVAAASCILGNLMMIPWFGFMGSVYSRLLMTCATTPVNAWYLKKAKVKVEISQCLKPVAVFILCLGILWISRTDLLIFRFIIILLYFAFCFALAVVKKEDFNVILRTFTISKPSVSELEDLL